MFPTAAIVLVAYSLGYVGITLIAVVFVFMLITKKWFYKMNEKHDGLTRAITFYFVAILLIHAPSPILLLLGKQHYHFDY